MLFFLNLLIVQPFSEADAHFFSQLGHLSVVIASLQVPCFILLLAHLRGWVDTLAPARSRNV
jgi:hypothetical protein